MTRKTIIFINFFIYWISILTAQEFTIAVIPDTQNYSYYKRQKSLIYPINNADIWYHQMEYIASNSTSNGGFIDFAVHVGDITESSRKGIVSEWEIADRAMSILDNVVPYVVVPGNHDYDSWVYDENKKFHHIEGGKQFVDHFGPQSKHFRDKNYYIDSFNGGLSSCSIFKKNDIEILVLALEIEPDDECLKWAQQKINENPGKPVLIVIHEFISIWNDIRYPGIPTFCNGALRKKVGGNGPTKIWKDFIYDNNQIFMVLCGHSFDKVNGERARTELNKFNFPVYFMLTDYQGRNEIPNSYNLKNIDCGDGWLRLLTFDLEKKEISVRTYSTELKKEEVDYNSHYTIKIDWDWNERFHVGNE